MKSWVVVGQPLVGNVVPESENLALTNDAVTLDATVLYADLADSTGLVDKYTADFAAEIYKVTHTVLPRS